MKRRTFIRNSVLTSTSAMIVPAVLNSCGTPVEIEIHKKIRELATSILEKWCIGLLANQTMDPEDLTRDGGIFSPGDGLYPGRSADALYPFLWMAEHTGDEKFLTAAKKVYAWEQNNCWSEEHGCWTNDPGRPDSWKSITVFGAITKMEAIRHYPHLLGEKTISEWKSRLSLAAEYLYRTFHIDYANINYPATGTYAFYMLGKLFRDQRYFLKAEELAGGLLKYFTPDGLFYGEGGRVINESGQYPVDLGYNVEESLPAMAFYSRLSGNRELYDKVLESMKVHLEFMLPDGAWDNSWGTRNFKWTIWGSRTSDGCHPGYYLLSDEEPVFAEAVYRNLQCLESSTFNNILQSGPHENLAGVAPSTHHTFDHAKALATLLNMEQPEITVRESSLPREKIYGVKKFNDINTVLFSRGSWRGTISAYNVEYKDRKNGHASGGSLTCLYHTKLGILTASSMTEYARWEKNNMLADKPVENFMSLAPRLELHIPGNPVYRNISDLEAEIDFDETEDQLIIRSSAKLVSGSQATPASGDIGVETIYQIEKDSFTMEISSDQNPGSWKMKFLLPLICSSKDEFWLTENAFILKNQKGKLKIESNYPLIPSLPKDKRVYNFVPGLQAYPIEIDASMLYEKRLILRFSEQS